MSITELPPHATRRRGSLCGCLACTHYNRRRIRLPYPDLRWPFHALEHAFTLERVRMFYSDEQIKTWKAIGLTDVESDNAAIILGKMPFDVWRGWLEACLDWEENRRV